MAKRAKRQSKQADGANRLTSQVFEACGVLSRDMPKTYSEEERKRIKDILDTGAISDAASERAMGRTNEASEFYRVAMSMDAFFKTDRMQSERQDVVKTFENCLEALDVLKKARPVLRLLDWDSEVLDLLLSDVEEVFRPRIEEHRAMFHRGPGRLCKTHDQTLALDLVTIWHEATGRKTKSVYEDAGLKALSRFGAFVEAAIAPLGLTVPGFKRHLENVK